LINKRLAVVYPLAAGVGFQLVSSPCVIALAED